VSVIDTSTVQGSSDDWDWGYSLVPQSQLSSQLVVGYAPGKPDEGPDGNPTDNGSLAFIVAVSDTVLYVDLDQDGRPDPFDMDGDGQIGGQDLWGVPEWDECLSAFGIPMQAGQVLRVGDPFDKNLEGARIYTADLGEHIAGAWGQDPIRADASSYIDLGYTLLPLSAPRVFKTDGLGLGASYLPGDVVTYTVTVQNNGMASMSEVVLMDALPYTYTLLLGSVQATTTPPTGSIEYDDGSQWLTTPTSDTQRLRITWPDLNAQQVVTITARVQVDTAIPASVTEVCNEALVTSANTDPVRSGICRPVRRPQLAVSKSVYPESVYPGDLVTYTVVVSNPGDGMGASTLISDLLPSGFEYLPGTLNLTWPAADVEIVTRTVTQTAVFRGYYADDFDGAPGETTGYGGSDGSLEWTGDWAEVGDDDDPGAGFVQVLADAANALTEPAYAWLGAPGAAESGLVRTLDLSLFDSPYVRYYRFGSVDADGDDAYRLTAFGDELLSETYAGDYCVRQVDLSDYAGQPDVTLSWLATTGMDAGELYRLDEVAVYDGQPERTTTSVLSNEVTTYAYRTLSGDDPMIYDRLSGQVVFTDALSLIAGGTFTVTYQARVNAVPPPAGSMWLTNTACVTTTHWLENVPALPCDDAPVRVVQQADLTIDKSDQPDLYVLMGEVLTYTLAYRNLGGEEVQDAVLSDTLPSEVVFGGVVSQPPGWSAPPVYEPGPPATLTWSAPTLPAGAGGEIVYTVTVSSEYEGPLVNQACIATTTPEADYENNCDLEESVATPEIADLAIIKTDGPDPGVPGELLTYTLEYVNWGPYDAAEVYITDTFPAGITFEEVVQQPSGWEGPVYSAGPQVQLTWYRPVLAVGTVDRIVYTVLADEDVPGRIDNQVCISSATADPVSDNNCDIEPTAVRLLYLNTLRLPHAVLIRWETVWEVNSYGFVLLRRAAGRQAGVEEIAFLPAAGRGGGGAAYRYLDAGLESDTAYTYWLVEVDKSGRRTTFGSAVSAASSEFPHQIYLPISVRR
jgi:uncharacterized repeat protein (TIGR01451 family)